MFLAPVGEAISGFSKSAAPLLQAAGGFVQADAQSKAYGSQADVANYNAALYNQQATLVESAQEQNAKTLARTNRAKLSAIRANIGSRGLSLSGSPLLVLAESAAALELDQQNQEFNASVEAARYRSQAVNYGVEAKNYKIAGRSALNTGSISTAYKIASQY